MSSAGGQGKRVRPRLSIRSLLLAVNIFSLAVPLVSIVALRVFDDQLIRRTEEELIAQSVLIAEAWREGWLRAAAPPHAAPSHWEPPGAGAERYFPVRAELSLDQGVLPPAPEPERSAALRDGPAWQAGAAVQPMLERAVRMNLSSARVLDAQGCVVASSAPSIGQCLEYLDEVRAALGGRYAAVLRHRFGDDPPAGIDSISRRGRVRVFTALPVFEGGAVIGVVRMSRTALDPVKALWIDRYRLLLTLGGCALLSAALSLFLSRTLERPLGAITRLARAIARGEARVPRASATAGAAGAAGGDGVSGELAIPRLAPQELRELGAALEQMIAQLSERADYIRDFAANVSHELKTPITAIRGAAELLAHQWREMDDATRARFLANIDADAERMQRLVTHLLQLARIQSAPEPSQEVELAPFLNALRESYGAPLHWRVGALPRALRIAPDHLESALRNLIENALRHGAGAPVEVEADAVGERVRIRVRDRGPGISEGNRGRIFQRFFTTERDRGGTGLGLNIAKAVADNRGGELSFSSGPDGTCFTLLL